MRILFDSRDSSYKTPFGTIRTGQRCILRILIPTSCGAVGVRLMLENCEYQPAAEYAFVKEKDCGRTGYDSYCCSFNHEEKGLYFYWFYIEKQEGGFRLFRQGSGTNMEAGDKWQLSVIPADFTTPGYAAGAVMYQILPDRFYRAGECDLTDKLQPFTVHTNWFDTPNCSADSEGNWCGDFFGGNLNGVKEKLPYLKELGVDIIYFNPIFMAYSNHRYDTADYKRIDPMLGTEADFQALCAQAHAHGIHIVLDGVFSHTGSNSVYFDAKHHFGHGAVSDPASPYREWYHFRHYPNDYESWWNMPTLPNVEELTPSYLHYIIDDEDSVVAHWLRLGADGFRLDVADELPDEFILRLKQRIRQIKPEAFLIGEVWEDASNKRAYSVSRRYFVDGELDSVMNYPWRTAILRYVTGEDDGAGIAETVMSITENYPPQVLACVMNLLGTHDTPRILTALADSFRGSREEEAKRILSPQQREMGLQRLRLASFLQFTLPGMPSIYYGDEAGMEGYGDPFCRRTYPWGREDVALLSYFKSLTRLRHDSTALKHGDIRVLEGGKGRLAFIRTAESGEIAYVLINLSDRDWTTEVTGNLRFAERLGGFDGKQVRLLPGGYCMLQRNQSDADCIS